MGFNSGFKGLTDFIVPLQWKFYNWRICTKKLGRPVLLYYSTTSLKTGKQRLQVKTGRLHVEYWKRHVIATAWPHVSARTPA